MLDLIAHTARGLSLRLRHISTQRKFPHKENFVKCDWPTQLIQILRRKQNFEDENFQLLTMKFLDNFLSVEMGLDTVQVYTTQFVWKRTPKKQ